mmetsp:Transcript_26876/g.77815  ORF Transcript_26876/g.77815 Transcript_26876/m.77815 type:complete len:258 (+) Transcript_26876:2234-3007(+)
MQPDLDDPHGPNQLPVVRVEHRQESSVHLVVELRERMGVELGGVDAIGLQEAHELVLLCVADEGPSPILGHPVRRLVSEGLRVGEPDAFQTLGMLVLNVDHDVVGLVPREHPREPLGLRALLHVPVGVHVHLEVRPLGLDREAELLLEAVLHSLAPAVRLGQAQGDRQGHVAPPAAAVAEGLRDKPELPELVLAIPDPQRNPHQVHDADELVHFAQDQVVLPGHHHSLVELLQGARGALAETVDVYIVIQQDLLEFL